jgi:uncharacterized protein
MKYTLQILVLCLLVLNHETQAQNSSVDPNGYNIFYFENGQKSSEGNLKNGQPEGYWKNYFESGVLKSEGNRQNGKLDSIWKFYSEEGILREEISFKNDLKSGVTNNYNTEGFLIASTPFKENKKQGLGFTYFTNGGVSTETIYANGAENGTSYEFAPTGEIIGIRVYQNGILTQQEAINRKNGRGERIGLWKEFYEDRTVKLEGRYSGGKKNGYWKEYSPKSKLVQTYKYLNGELVENAEELTNLDIKQQYYPGSDGKVSFRGSYRKGLAQGTHLWYDKNGQIDSSKIYTKGKLVAQGKMDAQGLRQGFWKEFYYPDGELKAEGEYKNGYRFKVWKFYYEDGKLQESGSYGQKEKLEGKWKWFYENGQILLVEDYKNGKEDGISIEYNDTGKVVAQGEYVNGLEEGEWFYEIGDHLEEGRYEYGLKQGVWKHTYVTTREVRFEGEFYDDLPQGKHVWYYDTGIKRLEGEYISGIKDGLWRRFDKEGSILISIDYQSGNEVKVDGYKLKFEEK